ncbi:hypothetical protein SAMN04487934_11815 [Eubacterium ruminantium]|nr:hypothetical protein SAMN04487934_11815 [Eubacterium ruminantium]
MSYLRHGLMVKTAQKYHGRYSAEIAYRMGKNRHLSVLLPSLLGIFPIIPNIYDSLAYRDRLFVIVESQDIISEINKTLFGLGRDEECIYPITVNDCINELPEGDCYILYDLNQDSRIKLIDSLGALKDSVVISVGRLERINSTQTNKAFTSIHANEILNELYDITLSDGEPQCMIFNMDSILDIRDISLAPMSEKELLLKELYDVCNSYEKDKKKTGSALDNNDKLIMYQKAQEELELQIRFLKMVAASAGVNSYELEDCLDKIHKIKADYSIKFESIHSEDEMEILETEFQTVIADLCVQVTKGLMTLDRRDEYETSLIDSLTNKVWNMLTKHSQMYLISALMTFDSLDKMPDKDTIDFSGVCLQVTKVLDEEMSLRLFVDYKSYLSNQNIVDWPKAMKQKNQNGNFVVLPEHKFTIGSIEKVIGYDVAHSRVSDRKSFNSMKKYAKERIYESGKSSAEIERSLISIAVCAEKTRNDYRNPSAHRNTMPYISAKECIEYLIDQTQMLKEIMKDMRY